MAVLLRGAAKRQQHSATRGSCWPTVPQLCWPLCVARWLLNQRWYGGCSATAQWLPVVSCVVAAASSPSDCRLQGLKELKAKVVPGMLSVLLKAVFVDVAHLLGGVVIALSTLHAEDPSD